MLSNTFASCMCGPLSFWWIVFSCAMNIWKIHRMLLGSKFPINTNILSLAAVWENMELRCLQFETIFIELCIKYVCLKTLSHFFFTLCACFNMYDPIFQTAFRWADNCFLRHRHYLRKCKCPTWGLDFVHPYDCEHSRLNVATDHIIRPTYVHSINYETIIKWTLRDTCFVYHFTQNLWFGRNVHYNCEHLYTRSII